MERGRDGARRRTRPQPRRSPFSPAWFPPTSAADVAPAPAAYVSVESNMTTLAAPIVGLAATPTGKGYWRAGADGGVLSAGDTDFYGSATHVADDAIVAIAATRTGHGYWLTDRRGAVFTFGDAAFHGSMSGHPLNLPIVGMAATPDGKGYWLVASDGGIFSFNAPFRGSTGGMRLNQPIVGMSATPDGKGYWLVASDGGVFAFNAPFYGSTGAIRLDRSDHRHGRSTDRRRVHNGRRRRWTLPVRRG